MEHIETAESLLREIQQVKKAAISKGALREEKPSDPITPQEQPYQLPNGWMWVRLGDYALKVTDYVASGSFASLKENVLITNEPNYAIMVKTADFATGFTKGLTYTDRHGYEFLSNSNLFGGELILSNIGSIGKVFIVPYLGQPMTLASNTVMVKVTNDELIKYLYYYFLSPLGQRTLKSISSGTSMMKFNKTQLKNTLVPVAPLSEQKYIVNLLERTQGIIDHLQQQLHDLDALIKARFVEMFGDPVSNPKGWRVIPWEGVFDTKTGKLDSNAAVEGGEYPFFTCAKEWLWIDKYAYDCEALLLAGNNAAGVYDVKHYKGKFNAYQRTYILQLKDADWSYSLFKYQLEDRLQYLQSQSKGTNTRYLTMGILNSLTFIVPPKELQDEFTTLVSQVDKSKVVVQEALNKAKLLFDSLMQQYFG